MRRSGVDDLASRLTQDQHTCVDDVKKLKIERDLLKSIIDEQLVFKLKSLEDEVKTLKYKNDDLVVKNNDLTYKLRCLTDESNKAKNEQLKNQRDYFNKKHESLIKQNDDLQKERDRLKDEIDKLQLERDDLKQKLDKQVGLTEGFKTVLDELLDIKNIINIKFDKLFDLLKNTQDQKVSTLLNDISTEIHRPVQNDAFHNECRLIREFEKDGLSNVEIAQKLYPGLTRGPKKVSERKRSDYYRSLS